MAIADTETIKVLDRALTLLDVLRDENRPLGVNELSKLCDINLSTVFRIMKTLMASGWVYQSSDDKYTLGEKWFFQTNQDNLYLALKDIAYPIMFHLSVQEFQAMNLCVRQNEKCIILQQSRTEKLVDLVPRLGASLPVYASGSGKVLFSELVPPLLDDLLSLVEFKKLASETIISRQAFIKELEKVRAAGYALDVHESMDATSCVAVPVRNPSGNIIAALSFSGFVGDYGKEQLISYLPILLKASEEISQKLFRTSQTDSADA